MMKDYENDEDYDYESDYDEANSEEVEENEVDDENDAGLDEEVRTRANKRNKPKVPGVKRNITKRYPFGFKPTLSYGYKIYKIKTERIDDGPRTRPQRPTTPYQIVVKT